MTLLGCVWLLATVAVVILLVNRPMLVGIVVSIPWFWAAWTAAECGSPFGSFLLFLDGAALLWMGVDLSWRAAERAGLA